MIPDDMHAYIFTVILLILFSNWACLKKVDTINVLRRVRIPLG